MISEPSVLTPVQESPSAASITTLPPPSVSATPPVTQQTTTPIPTPPITTDAPTITTAVLESDALFAVQLKVAKLEKDVSELKKVDLSTEALVALKTQVPTVVEYYLGSRVGDTPTVNLEQESKKSPSGILKIKKEQAEKQKMSKFTIKSTDKATLKETNESDSSKKHPPPRKPQNCKASSKGSKTGKSALAKELVENSIAEVVMDDAGDDVVRNDDQPQDDFEPKIAKTSKLEWILSHSTTSWPLLFTSPNILDWNNLEGDCYPFDLPSLFLYKVPQEILGMKSVSVKKLHRYGHLEEIMVKRSDQQLYRFKEGDFIDLHLNDIEDMLLLTVQHKLSYLDGSDIVDFIVALRMFTRSLIIKRRVKDLQHGVESYQKKLKITKPQKTFPEIEFKEPYTPSYNPPGQ
nr:hypothetical protein [Tanacetum cinerariifolium]